MNQKEDLLMDIGIVSFTLVDLALFLDTHPTDRTAMEYFNHYVRIKNQLEREFSMKYTILMGKILQILFLQV